MLKQSTAVTKLIGPFVDDGDGKTAETGLTISQADIRLSKNGGDMAQTNNAAGATHDELGYYAVPLDTTDSATLGSLKVCISKAGALPVWAEYMVVPAAVYDSLVLGTDYLPADTVQISGDSAAADNLEAAADGTGYNLGGGSVVAASVTAAVETDAASRTASKADVSLLATSAALAALRGTDDDTLKTLSDQIDALPTAAAINYPADETGYTLTAGTLVSGTVADTATVGTPMVFAPTGAAVLDVQFEFELATARPSELIVRGYYDGGAGLLTSKYAHVYAYDYAAADWDLLSDAGNRIASGTANAGYVYVLSPQHQDTTGTVLIRYVSSRIDATDRLYIDQQLVSGVVTGATVGDIAEGVWLHNIRNRQLDGTHRSAGYFLSRTAPEWAGVTNVTGAVVTMTPGDHFNGTVGAYDGRLVQFHKNGEFVYELRYIVSQAADGALTLDQAPVLVESSGWHGYVLPVMKTSLDATETQATAAAALGVYDGPTKAELDAAVADLALEATAQEILTDTGTTLPAAIAAIDTALSASDIAAIVTAIDATSTQLVAILNAIALLDSPTGSGSTPITHATLDDTADTMCYKTAGGAGIGDALVLAYVTSEYAAGIFNLQAFTRTVALGEWKAPLYLDPGNYTIVFTKLAFETVTTTVTITE